jgi:hypothetical protein
VVVRIIVEVVAWIIVEEGCSNNNNNDDGLVQIQVIVDPIVVLLPHQ